MNEQISQKNYKCVLASVHLGSHLMWVLFSLHNRCFLVRGDGAVTRQQSPGWVLLCEEAVYLEHRCCRVVSPLSHCESVPKYFCCLKIQTNHQITMAPQQLSIFLLEDLGQRPKSKVAMEVQMSLVLGSKSPDVTGGRELYCYVCRGCSVVKQGGTLIVTPFTCSYLLFKFTFETKSLV